MSTQTIIYCHHCDEDTLQLVDKCNHIVHILMSIITSGVWIPIWIINACRRRNGRCMTCKKWAHMTRNEAKRAAQVDAAAAKTREGFDYMRDFVNGRKPAKQQRIPIDYTPTRPTRRLKVNM